MRSCRAMCRLVRNWYAYSCTFSLWQIRSGGGIVKGPLMLEMGVLPAVSVVKKVVNQVVDEMVCTVSYCCLHDSLYCCICIHLLRCVWDASVSTALSSSLACSCFFVGWTMLFHCLWWGLFAPMLDKFSLTLSWRNTTIGHLPAVRYLFTSSDDCNAART